MQRIHARICKRVSEAWAHLTERAYRPAFFPLEFLAPHAVANSVPLGQQEQITSRFSENLCRFPRMRFSAYTQGP
jgi:hypothetical protein